MNEYDVIVVGGGPAGSSAAKAVAERGAIMKPVRFERMGASD